MSSSPPMTLEEHQALGVELQTLNKRLVELQVDLSRRYGKTKQPRRRAEALVTLLLHLRHEMENQAYKDLAEFGDTSLYWPGAVEAKRSGEST